MVRHRTVLAVAAMGTLVVAASMGMTAGRDATASAADAQPFAATAGCAKAPSLSSGSHTIQSSGQNRSYILRVPASYDGNHPYRLIFGFHWNGGTAGDVDSGGTDGYKWS